jgi:predicted nucleic acid-binding protein
MGPYEASYVALAEALDAVLLTADIGLSRARGLGCQVELLTES